MRGLGSRSPVPGGGGQRLGQGQRLPFDPGGGKGGFIQLGACGGEVPLQQGLLRVDYRKTG